MENKIFQYNGNNITFQSENGDTMVNATQMAKPFGKSPNHWLRNNSSKEFINQLGALRNRNPSDLVCITNGDNGNTWLHEDVALEFARWLSPKFAIWCNDRIKELFKYGFSATENTLERIQANPDIIIQLATALKEERERHQRELQEERERHQAEMEEERDYSFRTTLDFSKQADKTLQARKETLAFRKKAKDYLFIADGMKHLLKENNIRIPENLLLYKEDYDFLYEKDPDMEAFMKNRKKTRK